MAAKYGMLGDRPPEVMGLAETMSELAISGYSRPPPNKIRYKIFSHSQLDPFNTLNNPDYNSRRRNAITIQDPYPYNLISQPNGFVDQANAFENSFMLQRMEELQQRLGSLDPYELSLGKTPTDPHIVPPPPSPVPFSSPANPPNPANPDEFGDVCHPGKRKVPYSRRQIGRISLHQDLQAITPKSELSLPECILRKYTAKQSNALVLYQPPVNLIEKLLQAESEEKESASEEELDMNDTEECELMFD